MQWLQTLLDNELLYHTAVAVVIILVFYPLTRVVRSVLQFLGTKILTRTATVLDDRILQVLLQHIKPLMLVIALQIAVHEIRKGATAADLTLHQMLDYAGAALYIALVLVFVKIFLAIIREIVNWYLEKVSAEGTSNLKDTLGPLTSKVMDILVLLVAVIIIFDHFGINIGSLLVSLGVGSLAVALAAQDTLSNMIAGFVILVDRPFRVGDRIEIASGQVGDVREIGLRSTKVLNFDNNLIIMPNSDLVKSRIINYSFPYLSMRVLLRFDVSHGTDTSTVRRILLDLAERHPAILKDPPPRVYLTALTDASVQFSLTARCVDFRQQYDAETQLREQAYEAFLSAGIRIPAPHRIVHTKADA